MNQTNTEVFELLGGAQNERRRMFQFDVEFRNIFLNPPRGIVEILVWATGPKYMVDLIPPLPKCEIYRFIREAAMMMIS